jgi:dethiobiotin synthetase
VPLAGPTVCIWGANTGVGKTIVSAGLAHAAAEAGVSFFGDF